ncbi:hypothetical protein N656DRAFT_783210 [Canariomyces notabilis]|uniref:Uncharacterized protein n=1 Tax=Canariomyces notabilis TaxID=2074819 RepID=A0AAN6T926_9PEZI|nr:hypothetical protein N656DRAFT_783210 [Canariomyces arenarius]
MKFFSAALAALAVGSAMAAPTIADNVLETVDNTVDSVTRRTTPAQDCQACPLPSPPSCPNGGCAGGVDVVDVNVDVHAHADVVVKINEATKIVLDAKALIKADIDLIGESLTAIVAQTVKFIPRPAANHPFPPVAKLTAATVVKVDAQALLKAIVDLKLHVKILVDEVLPCLHGIVHDAHDLVAADLEVALKLIAEIQALLVDVEVCIKALVAAVKAGKLSPAGLALNAMSEPLLTIVFLQMFCSSSRPRSSSSSTSFCPSAAPSSTSASGSLPASRSASILAASSPRSPPASTSSTLAAPASLPWSRSWLGRLPSRSRTKATKFGGKLGRMRRDATSRQQEMWAQVFNVWTGMSHAQLAPQEFPREAV